MISSRFFAAATWSCLLSATLLGQQKQVMQFDLAAQPQSPFLGLGIEFDPYMQPIDPARWRVMLDHVAGMQPGFFRVMSGADDYCTGFDSHGNPQYRWKSDPNAPELRRVYDVLDFAQQHGIEVYLGEWSAPRNLGISSPADPRWSRIVADFVAYLVRERHYTILHHYILMNEPNGDWMWRGSHPDFEAWASGIRTLRRELDARGLQSVLLTGPDNSGGRDWFRRSVADLHDTFGAWEEHVYAKDEDVSSGAMEARLIEDGKTLATLDPAANSKVRFIAESGLETGKIEDLDQQPRVHDFDYGARMADYIVQIARAGWGGADAWDLDDAMHGNGRGGQKIWGFFDSSTDAGMQPRPWYYTWYTLSRAMPRNASIVRLSGNAADPVRGTAAVWTKDGKQNWSVVLVNHTDQTALVSITLPGASGPVVVYHYFEDDRPTTMQHEPRAAATLQNIKGALDLTFPSRGFIVLTTASAPAN